VALPEPGQAVGFAIIKIQREDERLFAEEKFSQKLSQLRAAAEELRGTVRRAKRIAVELQKEIDRAREHISQRMNGNDQQTPPPSISQ
jgi:hypothetical protein